MESIKASKCPPISLRQRELLEATKISFFVPPIPRIFSASAAQVLNQTLLIVFVNDLLSGLRLGSTMKDIPEVDNWGLEGHDGDLIVLKNWDPQQRKQDVYKVVPLPTTSDIRTLQAIQPRWALLGGGSWKMTSSAKSIELPLEDIFEVQSSHLLVVVYCQQKVKVSNKKKRIEQTKHSMLIPSNSTMLHLVKAFKETSQVFGVFEGLESEHDMRMDTRSVTELGWEHGIKLRLQMW